MSENRQCAGRTGAECAIISRCFVTDSDERTRLVNDEQDEDEQGDFFSFDLAVFFYVWGYVYVLSVTATPTLAAFDREEKSG